MTIEQLPPAAGNPFAGLLRSRKVWVALLDAIASTALYFVGKYAGASLEDLRFVISIYQPILGLVIIGIFVEDTAKMQAHSKMQVARTEAEAWTEA
jgi:cation transport ATPase